MQAGTADPAKPEAGTTWLRKRLEELPVGRQSAAAAAAGSSSTAAVVAAPAGTVAADPADRTATLASAVGPLRLPAVASLSKSPFKENLKNKKDGRKRNEN